ncbi:type II toxin-antitoxin system RelB/DinJ family antitoxin [Loigolactobacillus coryniformis]|uniref:type II toxin-antitoxin system RelB/DinJ family antitoxin n=1 Tax=Loigolactobacillus coryniformis TaxID=1610 RepID=UPI0003073E28|nr:type II toxin-antitoxin system RelB/DinJ family antitoxin [Loigolactobacillus coryniformis]
MHEAKTKKIAISFKVDQHDKELATEIYKNLGLNLSTAFQMFLKKSIAEGGLPFDARDPFYSQANIENILASKKQLDDGQGAVHDLIGEE